MYLALDIMKYVWGVFLFIDQAIYNLIRWIYKIFLALAKLNLFDESDYQAIVSRIYVVLGVIMLFVLAYSLLKAVINPDDFAKGETSFPNLIKNIVISIIIIAVLPTVFTFALNVQNAILNQDTIGKVILNPSGNLSSTEITNNGGNTIAYWTFRAFFYPNIDYCMDNAETDENGETYFDINNCAKSIKSGDEFTWGGFFSSFMMGAAGPILYGGSKLFDLITGEKYITLAQAFESVEKGGSFLIFTAFANVVNEGNISYIPVVSTLVGGFELFILVSYCIALALRAVKLAFYQIIAPIPVICRVMPGDKKKIFDNWVKQIIGTFIDVFSRVAILYLGVYLISIIVGKFNGGLSYASFSSINPGLINLKGSNFAMISTMPLLSSSLSTLDPIARLFALAFIIVGILMFVKSAPNMIKDLLGIDLGGGLNPFKIFQDATSASAPLAAGIGGGVTTALRNYNTSKANNEGGLRKFGSTLAGFGSGAARGAFNARNAKTMADIKKATSEGIIAATDKKSKRDAYRVSHEGQVMEGHLKDAWKGIKTWAGAEASLKSLQSKKAVADEMQGFYKTMAEYVSDNEMVANYAGLYEAEMKREISTTEFDKEAYDNAVNSKISALRKDSRYRSMSDDNLRNLVTGELDKNQFMKKIDVADAIEQRQKNLKMYDNLKKMATIKAINEKLSKLNADGTIEDGRFQAIANQVEVFKKQHADLDFVQSMRNIKGVTWDSQWDGIMKSNDAAAIDDLLSRMKKDPSIVSFFNDSERAKNESGRISADIAKLVQENKGNQQ